MLYSGRGDHMPRQKSGNFDQAKYIKEYNNEHIKYRKLSLNIGKDEDVEIMEWLDSRPEGTSAYLKSLILEDMKKHQ